MIKGYPLVLVHGLIGTLRELVPAFAGLHVKAHAPDLLGYGALQDVDPCDIGLRQQVAHIIQWMDERDLERVHLLGHSVGGAVAMLLAYDHPERVCSLVSVEGNFSLADAFWSSGVARMSAKEAEVMMEDFRDDPAGWLERSDIPATSRFLLIAERLLANQPASTVQATARSVVEVTGAPEYEHRLRAVFRGAIPIHLVAGDKSRAAWNVPHWASSSAASETLLPGGHLLMFEDPERFAAAIVGLLVR